MSTPEIIPEQMQQPEIVAKPEQPIVPETIQSIGVQSAPQAPNPVVSDNQVIASPTPTTVSVPQPDPTPTLTVPAAVASDEKTLEKGAHGPANLGVTWLDMFWLREVGKAIQKGWKVIFG